MKREKFVPIDLAHIQERAISAQHSLKLYRDGEKSPEFRAYHLRSVEAAIYQIINDIDYHFDTKVFGEKRAMGLDDNPNTSN